MTRTMLRISGVLCLVLALGACSGVKKQLGLEKEPLDEFRVTARAPLSVPPDLAERPLNVPEPGAVRPQEGTTQDQARNAVFKIEDPNNPTPESTPFDDLSPGEKSLLMAAGADQVDPNIRTIVNRETNQLNENSEQFIETLVFWKEPDPSGEIVDAQEEARRLSENAALGKEPTTGATPSVERREKALFEGVF